MDTAEGWLYVAVVLDLFSRRVVGWSMKPEMTAQLVMDALVMAVLRRGKPKELLHHSDQCSQYAAEDFQRLLTHHGIECSISKKGKQILADAASLRGFIDSRLNHGLMRRLEFQLINCLGTTTQMLGLNVAAADLGAATVRDNAFDTLAKACVVVDATGYVADTVCLNPLDVTALSLAKGDD